MAKKPFGAGFGRLPSRVREGSKAYWRKQATISARGSMETVIGNYNRLVRVLENSSADILEQVLQPVLDKSQFYVPKKTGALASTAELTTENTTTGAEARITYGSPDVFYAAIVHEFTWLNHQSPTRAKYLQTAMEEEIDNFLERAAQAYVGLM